VYQPTIRNASFTSGMLKVPDTGNHLTKGWSERESRVAHPSVRPQLLLALASHFDCQFSRRVTTM
jgi:hypothetical protein